ncbi:acyl-CoA N-acyltransferase [Scheffersomyces coipomensis]|uniref:acyl-CoA N-acyltransferase n=1 Tax=Scheffersomyces coipomensis TaxID=1788519 RepID=UPI00315C9C50
MEKACMSDAKSTGSEPNGKGKNKKDANAFYGMLDTPNIKEVTFGKYTFNTWYGNAAYFNSQDFNHSALGYEYSNMIAADPTLRRKSRGSITTNGDESQQDNFWLDHLFVCEFCFKYTSTYNDFQKHRIGCTHNVIKPKVGKLVYRDDVTPYYIREVKGYMQPLFCQNLCLFGKLFLDDKSVYYNIDHFNFYIIYGYDYSDIGDEERYCKPMGFFSKERLAYDNDNNLACICIFPPFQRRHLGSLLIEFSYELAKETPGQYYSGPEFPLSPFGKVSYYTYWSRKLVSVIHSHLKDENSTFTLRDLSQWTRFRKEDILLTLEYMKLLQQDQDGNVTLLLGNLDIFCKEHNIDPLQEKSMIKTDCLLI